MGARTRFFIPLHLRVHGPAQGLVHTSGGYIVYTAMTHEYVFDYTRGGRLLVHRRLWAGSPATALHRSTGPLANGSDHADFEGVPTCARRAAGLGRSARAQGQPVSTLPPPRSRLIGQGTDMGGKARPLEPETCSAPTWASPGIFKSPRPGTGTTIMSGKGRLPIVDTCWQTGPAGNLLDPACGRHAAESRALPDKNPSSAFSPSCSTPKNGRGRSPRAPPRACSAFKGGNKGGLWGGPPPPQMRTVWGRSTSGSRRPISRTTSGYYFSGDGLPRDARWRLLDHRPRGRC